MGRVARAGQHEPRARGLSSHDLLLTPGPRFAAAGVLERHLRLPFTLAPEQLERAVEILAEVATSKAAPPALEPRISYVA